LSITPTSYPCDPPRVLAAESLAAEVKRLLLRAASALPAPVHERLSKAAGTEPSPRGRRILGALLENAALAASSGAPLCQDTGLAQVIVELGHRVHLSGPPLAPLVDQAVREAYGEGFLRKSTCHPLTRENLGDNAPASLELLQVPGDGVKVVVLAKGGGCDNKSASVNLPPTASRGEVLAAAAALVGRAGPDACPPYFLGLCVGGSFESAPRLARRALVDIFETPPMTAEEETLAGDLLKLVNASGLGPLGLGGRTTALGCRVKIHPTHLASLPVALNLNCHSLRTGRSIL
jgi:fumarate hydratase subunit alpha